MWSFWQRSFPDANIVLLHGPAPVLIDSGDASSAARLLPWLAAEGAIPSMLANTHHHSDHVGGNATLAARGVPIAAHAAEAALRAPNAAADADPGDLEWLGQTAPDYPIDRTLADGDVIDTGSARWTALHTPGHSVGHLVFWNADARTLVGGDTVFADGIAWLPPRARHPDAFAQAADTLARIAALDPRIIAPGHGPLIEAPRDALDAARRRLARLADNPAAAARHAARRIVMHAILVLGGLTPDGLADLAVSPWCVDCAAASGMTPDAFVASVAADLTGSGAANVDATGRTVGAPGR